MLTSGTKVTPSHTNSYLITKRHGVYTKATATYFHIINRVPQTMRAVISSPFPSAVKIRSMRLEPRGILMTPARPTVAVKI